MSVDLLQDISMMILAIATLTNTRSISRVSRGLREWISLSTGIERTKKVEGRGRGAAGARRHYDPDHD